MRLAWMTDIHLNFLGPEAIGRFLKRVLSKKVDGLLIAGDIGEADSVVEYLDLIQQECRTPIYFVLGNHDFYRGSITDVGEELVGFLATRSKLIWTTRLGVVSLSPSTALIGHDSLCDGGFGDYWKSTIALNDFNLIEELHIPDRRSRLEVMQRLAQEAAEYFKKLLPEALERHKKVIVLTHVPPFRESACFRGKISGPEWLPYFTCKIVGDVLLAEIAKHPDKEVLVLCGHTHGKAEYSPLPNLRVITGPATYGKPRVQGVIDVD